MKFSVIVPVYNVEKYLPECVNSILNQNYEDFELILVDDGSPDNCPAICDEYTKSDSRVKVVHKENGGLSDARNAGVDAATGDYILFIDSDDYWNNTSTLTKLSEIIEKNTVDIVQFGQEKLYQLENRIAHGTQRTLSQYNGKTTTDILGQLVSSEKLTISACSMAISRAFFVNNSLYFKKGLKTEDLEWAVRLYVCEPKWAFSDEYFYIYRMQREGSISATVDHKHLCDYCWIIEHSIELIEKQSNELKTPLMSYLMYHILIASAFAHKVKLQKQQKRELLSRLKALANGRITKYAMNKKVKLAAMVYRMCGFNVMSAVLGFYLNNRSK